MNEQIDMALTLLAVLGIEGVMTPACMWSDAFIDTHYIAQQIWAERNL